MIEINKKKVICPDCESEMEIDVLPDLWCCNYCGLAFFMNEKGEKFSLIGEECPQDDQDVPL